VKARIRLAVDGLDPRRTVHVRHRRDGGARRLEPGDALEYLVGRGRPDPLPPPDLRDPQDVRAFDVRCACRTWVCTGMVLADAASHGERDRLLGFDDAEHPVALQLGGSDPRKLAEAARIGEAFGYDEINLNVGCPSDRVQSGTFGACLMRVPVLVADCVAAMKAAVSIPVTVKCRIGVDEQDPEPALDTLADAVFAAGADALWVHARKAWLEGLSPKENRDIPPLDYERVYRLKSRKPNEFIGINGGIQSLEEARRHLDHVDGAMLGRAAYPPPGILAGADSTIYGGEAVAFGFACLTRHMRESAARPERAAWHARRVESRVEGYTFGRGGTETRALQGRGSLRGRAGSAVRAAVLGSGISADRP